MALGADPAVDAALLAIFDAATGLEANVILRTWLLALGVSTDPAHYGVPPERWQTMARQAASGPRGRNFIRTLA